MSEPTAAERALAAQLQLDPVTVAAARDALNAIASLAWPSPTRAALLAGVAQSAGADIGPAASTLALAAAPLASFDALLSIPELGIERLAGLARALSGFDVGPLRGAEAGPDVPPGNRASNVMRISDVATSVGNQVALVDHVLRSGANGMRLHGVDLRLSGGGTAFDGDVALDLGAQSGGSALAIAFVPSDAGFASTSDAQVPDVRGYTAVLAQRKLAAGGFGATVISVADSGGIVADQSPSPGAQARKGSAVRLIVRDAESAAASPAFHPAPGRFVNAVSIGISTPTAASTIRYTLDETEPTASNGITYTAPVTLSRTATLKARAFRWGFQESPVVSGVYKRLVPSMTIGVHTRIGVDTVLGGTIESEGDEQEPA